MRDEQVGQAQLCLQVVEQVQDLVLYEHVERGHGFVQDDDFRVEREGAGYGHALALAAGEFVRVAAHGAARQGYHVEQLGGAFDAQLLWVEFALFGGGQCALSVGGFDELRHPLFGVAAGRLCACDFLLGVCQGAVAVDLQRFFDQAEDRVHRVQGPVGVLEHGLEAATQLE